MPTCELADAGIHYETFGDPNGFPVLCIAPGGLESSIARWRVQPWNPLERLSTYRVIAMDQRNAGRSVGAIRPDAGWATYTDDQLDLLDHLGIDACHVVGMCIGGPYILGLTAAAPDRIRAAVMLQPIGLSDNRQAFLDLFDAWRSRIQADHPEADDATWARFRTAMFGGDFVFNTSRTDAAGCHTPVLIAMGNDLYHPEPISRELARILPNAMLIEHWRAPEHRDEADQVIQRFLAANT